MKKGLSVLMTISILFSFNACVSEKSMNPVVEEKELGLLGLNKRLSLFDKKPIYIYFHVESDKTASLRILPNLHKLFISRFKKIGNNVILVSDKKFKSDFYVIDATFSQFDKDSNISIRDLSNISNQTMSKYIKSLNVTIKLNPTDPKTGIPIPRSSTENKLIINRNKVDNSFIYSLKGSSGIDATKIKLQTFSTFLVYWVGNVS